jgi:hypothetical protein
VLRGRGAQTTPCRGVLRALERLGKESTSGGSIGFESECMCLCLCACVFVCACVRDTLGGKRRRKVALRKPCRAMVTKIFMQILLRWGRLSLSPETRSIFFRWKSKFMRSLFRDLRLRVAGLFLSCHAVDCRFIEFQFVISLLVQPLPSQLALPPHGRKSRRRRDQQPL